MLGEMLKMSRLGFVLTGGSVTEILVLIVWSGCGSFLPIVV